ncbi:MAG: carboxypeptidase regulatory-like domain-containing protein [Acidobacteria bacterium]|nr:carboxypeptidase regulatory-like domain-containing protein [Acidobacteriota bacterium]
MSVKYLLAVAVFLILAGTASAQTIKINESSIAAVTETGRMTVTLPVESGAAGDARVKVELLDSTDKILDQTNSLYKLKSGTNKIEAALRIDADATVNELIWQRVRYSISQGGTSLDGIVSVSEIVPELFTLRIANIEEIHAGARFPVRINSYHPITNKAVGDVDVTAELEIELETDKEDDTLVLKGEGRTDANGFAEIVFLIPDSIRFDSEYSGTDVDVTGKKNGLTDTGDTSPNARNERTNVYFTSDKPIYQPGQTFHARALVMREKLKDSSITIVSGLDLTLSVEDEDGTVLSRQVVKTSEYGIAAIEWQIPPNAKLGTYSVEADSDEAEFRLDSHSFKVSRYELPNFVVKTSPDKDFYLPDQRVAEVSVDAMYLFGKPVASGTVKVVREGSRNWNYREQKWDIEEEAVYAGATGAGGKYKAKIDLGPAQDKFKDDEDSKFEDLNFTAYFTDSSTNRTEQKRFDLRISKEPIHVYVNKARRYSDHSPKIPYRLYVSTFTADGKPIACDVDVTGKYEDESATRPIATFRTSADGAGKTEFLVPKRADDNYLDDLEIKIAARDAENRTGTEKFGYELDEDERQIRVTADRSIYRKGQSLKIELLSSEPSESIIVDILKESSTLVSYRVKAKNGRASLRVPFRPEFKGFLTIAANIEGGDEDAESAWRVVFPDPRRLNVTAKSERETYRPNEEAGLGFEVAGFDKKAAQAALGIVVVDQAVEERARTDARSSDAPDIFASLRGFDGNTWNELADAEITPRMQLFAEMRFADWTVDYDSSGGGSVKAEYEFTERHKKQFEALLKALDDRFKKDFNHPTDDIGLRRILGEAGIDFDSFRDPWGMPFKAQFIVSRGDNLIAINSAGPNKRFGDLDDFRAAGISFDYFKKSGIAIVEAIKAYETRTGAFVRDTETLRAALAEKGISLESLIDRWGRPYRFEFGVYNRSFRTSIKSDGEKPDEDYDNFYVLNYYSDYFADLEKKIDEVLARYVAETKTFPADEAGFLSLIKTKGVDLQALRDGWGRPYYFNYEETSMFADRVTIENVAKQGEPLRETLSITPVTRRIGTFRILSLGENGTKDDYYDINIAAFSGILSEQVREDAKPKLVVPRTVFANGKSAVFGVVTDVNKASVAGAEVRVINSETAAESITSTNAEGAFLQTGLPAGIYSLRVASPGFKNTIVNQISLSAEQLLEVNVTLEAGAVNEVVTVFAGTNVINATETKISTTISRTGFAGIPRIISGGVLSLRIEPQKSGFQIDGASGSENVFKVDGLRVVTKSGGGGPSRAEPVRATPRLREYFPETLLFVPEIVTEKDGKIAIRYRLADNITTWKIYAVASDKQGRVGFAETSVKAFQPFFVDLDPPKFLTVGDEILLPAQVRNYTPQTQKVEVTMDRADWFAFIEPNQSRRTVEVPTNSSANAIFGFKANQAVTDGKQRVTAVAQTDSDAIEKPVTVRPDGEEIVRAESSLFNGSAAFDLDFPANALAKTQKAELKIFPNQMAHVTESVEGLLQRPYGCGEQTISSTYPNLMILKFVSGMNPKSEITNPKSPVMNMALKNLRRGYERLVGYQSSDGGFSYWGGTSESDLALTAYSLRFLTDAKAFVEVDESLIAKAREYLIKQQRADGSWTKKTQLGERRGFPPDENADDLRGAGFGDDAVRFENVGRSAEESARLSQDAKRRD